MNLQHPYYYFIAAISKDDCNKIIETGLKKINEDKLKGVDTTAVTFGNSEKQKNEKKLPQKEKSMFQLVKEGIDTDNVYVRDSEVAWLTDSWLYDLIVPYIKNANSNAGWNFEVDRFETFQFTIYHPGGFYSWHKDGGSDHNAIYKRYISGVTNNDNNNNDKLPQGYVKDDKMVGKVRKISMTLNLNEPGQYEGGNLLFDFGHHEKEQYYECKEMRPQGSMIIFPSFLPHCVTPLTKGVRYSLVLWCLGRPFK
jgi:PKHD-type hydroxylase